MSWIIGASTIFGYGIVFSDICVTCADGKTFDILQKAFPVGKYIVAGFAGSVSLGFRAIDFLHEFLKLPHDKRGHAWHPDWVGEECASQLRSIYENAGLEDQRAGMHILMVGVSPNEDIGVPGWARCYIVVLRSPEFHAEIYAKGNEIKSIGRGSGVEEYKKVLMELVKRPGDLQKWIAEPALSSALEENPTEGISKHLHIFTVARGEINLYHNDQIKFPHDSEPIVTKMPEVIDCYPGLARLLNEKNQDVKGLIC